MLHLSTPSARNMRETIAGSSSSDCSLQIPNPSTQTAPCTVCLPQRCTWWLRCAVGSLGRVARCSQGCLCSPCHGCRGSRSNNRTLQARWGSVGAKQTLGTHLISTTSLPRKMGWWWPWCPRCHLPAWKAQKIIWEVTQPLGAAVTSETHKAQCRML